MFKQEAEGKQPASEGQSLGPGGRKLKTVDSGANDLFGDDDEDGSGSRRRKDLDQDGDMDEQVYEEEFADDEENMNVDENDEEAKEIEVYPFERILVLQMIDRNTAGASQARIPTSKQAE